MDRYAGVLVRVLPVLGRDRVLLERHRLPGVDGAVLEDDGRVPEDEVDGPVNVALAVELALRVRIEGILIADDIAPVDHGVIRPDSEGHRLVLARPRPVLERYVTCNETGTGRSCTYIKQLRLFP